MKKRVLLIGLILGYALFIYGVIIGTISILNLVALVIGTMVYFLTIHYTRLGMSFILIGLITMIINYSQGFYIPGVLFIIGGMLVISEEE